MNTILLLSGGLDSVTLLYDLKHTYPHDIIHCVLFDYGQTHIKELKFARQHCEWLVAPYEVAELHRIKGLFKHCALTDGDGSVVVPNRNAVFLNIAASIAAGMGFGKVCYACNSDDAVMFPDCRQGFVESINQTLKEAHTGVVVAAPYIGMTKKQIVNKAHYLGIPLLYTWSCYSDQETPCGTCEACRLRMNALKTL